MKPTFFETAAQFRAWLEKHHQTADEIIVGFYRKDSGKPSITWSEAVDEALCFGWIDGIRRKHSDIAYSNRFTPRRPNSNWSAINIAKVEQLTREGRMRPAGLAAFEKRKASRSRVYSYEQKDDPEWLPHLLKKFKANKRAWTFFQGLPPYYRRGETRWINSAKQEETRLRRLDKVMAACESGRRR
ncbi:MAG TPA: YdeI/OmpD-associated family protein [Vicinamibacterales bacterium]|nr:YdeI/OmpD-associated family protein [Vicinamibacterales bacterium]